MAKALDLRWTSASGGSNTSKVDDQNQPIMRRAHCDDSNHQQPCYRLPVESARDVIVNQ